ncbi:MAG: glycine zipper 2TM domain-containing protein [Gammaproteobacteria bacterium]|nr:MAG: glycine zipper 2TM domain-containing protein [Gammaproteobacteria bacterium]TLZ05912.1 MAG: glycine zipper 2TM domain-containing protein [Gammaproteobacteria bacterium]TLZ42720.1 MAG: glycine zipper 2TM domain-containing protein [Gammaproteobacteria bacterium]
MNRTQTSIRLPWVAAMALAGLAVAGCVAQPAPRPVQRVYSEAPPPSPDVYAYPLHGQTPQQQDRDHYECSQWATQQTGFDPSAPGVPPHERVRVVSAGPPPGTGTAVGAVTGAIIGAAISRPWEAATGALAGAVVGGAIGNAADAANAQDAHAVVVNDRRQAAAQEQKAANYRRAIGACLDARGYSVR